MIRCWMRCPEATANPIWKCRGISDEVDCMRRPFHNGPHRSRNREWAPGAKFSIPRNRSEDEKENEEQHADM